KAVRETLQAFVKTYNARDAQALAGMFADDGAVIDSGGEATRGRQALAEMYANAFQDLPNVKLDGIVESLRTLTPDVVQVEGRARLAGGTGDAAQFTRFSTLVVRRDGRWRIAEIRDYPAPAEDITPAERLKELEWMVGEWVDETEGAKVGAKIRWADNKSF